MTELEELAEIGDQLTFGTGRMPVGHHFHRPAQSPRCGSPDHMKGPNVRVYRKGRNGKLRTVCRLCDALRRKGLP